MAFADDLQNLLESLLQAWDPTIDVSVGSSARTTIVDPLLRRFAEDPLATDIPKFVIDRVTQEYPELAADDGGILEDALIKPMQLLLEPFKREIQLTKTNQSVRNAAIMSDDEADAYAANWFEERDEGEFSGGTVRVYFSQPVTVRVGADKRVSTNSGLSYFPVQSYFITSNQMLFNRQGNLFFLDIVVRAEAPGENYNIDRNQISSIDQVPGVVKVTNPAPFIDGRPRETNEEFLGRTDRSLTEKSLNTKRGAVVRVDRLFDAVRAMQVVGAGDQGMNRDILKGTGEGFLHIVGTGTVYGDWLWASAITYRDDGPVNSVLPQAGDTIRFHPTSPAPTSTAVVSGKVVAVLSATSDNYLFLLDKSLYTTPEIRTGAFSLLKPGYITISEVPGGISFDATVPDNTVHLGGHTDIFVRPTKDIEVQGFLQSVSDERPLAAIVDLNVPVANTNKVVSSTTSFLVLGVKAGDVLVIETGAGFAGTYRILEVEDEHSLRVDDIFSAITTTSLRARVVRNIRVDLIEPHIPKLPFTPGPVSDLQTTVGSNEFRFSSINIQGFGAKVEDTINVLEGLDAGEFTIIGFNPTTGAAIVDRPATATGAALNYQVYTRLTGITRPLVRLKTLEVLDATGQGTGITVPYGDAVDIRPTGNFEGAGKEQTTYDKQLVIFPDMPEWAAGGLVPAPIPAIDVDETTDARYTLGLEEADGVVRTVTHHASNQIEKTEINVPPFLWNGRRDKLIALVSRKDNDFSVAIPGTHRTSDLAGARIGDSLTIFDGPNQGRYVITDLRVLELWGKADQGHRSVAVVQIDPPLKIDPIRTAINLINDVAGSSVWTPATLFNFLQYAADWDSGSGFYATFITQLRTTLTSLGIIFANDAALKTFFDPLVRTSYAVGPSAKGDFRLYFQEPVSAEFYFGDDPTTFDLATDGSKKFRLDPTLPPAQVFPEATEATPPTLWNRNLGVKAVQDRFTFLTNGSSLAKRGITVDDVVEFHPAILDLPSRRDMKSSWMCITQTGSNVVQLIVPPSNGTDEQGYGGADNYTLLSGGQLFFIDSGPDIGAYTIVKVLEQNWGVNPPVLKIQLDRPLTHTTEIFPALAVSSVPPPMADFNSSVPPFVRTSGNVFPMNLNGKKISFETSNDGGATWAAAVNYTFTGADPFANAAAVASELNTAVGFNTTLHATAVGNEIYINYATSGPRRRIRVVAPASPSAYPVLKFTVGETGKGGSGALAIPNTKRLYGSDLTNVQVGEWITIYAAKSDTMLTSAAPDDTAYLGTFKVTATGVDTLAASYLHPVTKFVELDRGSPFPVGEYYTQVRWLRHGTPLTEPSDTSGGGKDISDQFVRFRLYDAASKKLSVTSLSWTPDATHALLDTSEKQAELESPGLVDTAHGQRNYSHMSPYRILRPGVVRISSTAIDRNREGALYFVDLPVVGYGPGVEMNVSPGDGFVLAGRKKIDGYLLETEDENFAYSGKERVDIILPNAVLPVGSTADLENEFSLAGQNIQVTYNHAPLIEDIQSFFSSPQDRVTAANMLVRHFLPAYVFLDARYVGGSAEPDVAASIISYINNIDPDVAEIRADLVQDRIKSKGASKVELPITLIVLFHGIDRRIRGMRSETAIGISSGTPLFKGTYLQAYFIAGPDTSRKLVRPPGEQVFLVRS